LGAFLLIKQSQPRSHDVAGKDLVNFQVFNHMTSMTSMTFYVTLITPYVTSMTSMTSVLDIGQLTAFLLIKQVNQGHMMWLAETW